MIIYIDILIFVFLVTRFTLSIIQRIILIHFPCTRSYRKIYYRLYNSSTTIHVVKQPPQIIAFFTEEHRLILKIYSNILPALFSVMSTALPPIKIQKYSTLFLLFLTMLIAVSCKLVVYCWKTHAIIDSWIANL